MELFVVGMRNALSCVKKLKLTVDQRQIEFAKLSSAGGFEVISAEGYEQQQQQNQQQQQQQQLVTLERFSAESFIKRYPEELGVVAGSVFAVLASAVPKLCKLSLLGFCWDAALHSFGISCPHIASLKVDISTVSLKALQNFGNHLPHLVSISICGNNSNYQNTHQIDSHMDSFLRMTSPCLELKRLKIDCSSSDFFPITCNPGAWEMVPAGLQRFKCFCSMARTVSYDTLLRRVPNLFLSELPRDDLIKVLHDFPELKSLEMENWRERVKIVCGFHHHHMEDSIPNRRALLKERILTQGFSLSCFSWEFSGTCQQIQEVFEWLPPFSSVEHLSFFLEDEATPGFLGQVMHIFPSVCRVTLKGPRDAEAEIWDMEVLRPLMHISQRAMTQNTSFVLDLRCSQFALTVPGVEKLCRNAPASMTLQVAPWVLVDGVKFKDDFKQLGLECKLCIR